MIRIDDPVLSNNCFILKVLDCRSLFLILHNLTVTQWVRACDLSPSPLYQYTPSQNVSSCLCQAAISPVSDPGQREWELWAEAAVIWEMKLHSDTQQGCRLTKLQKAPAQYFQICLYAKSGFRVQGITNDWQAVHNFHHSASPSIKGMGYNCEKQLMKSNFRCIHEQ